VRGHPFPPPRLVWVLNHPGRRLIHRPPLLRAIKRWGSRETLPARPVGRASLPGRRGELGSG